MIKAREAAFKALSAFHKSGAWSDIYLRSVLANEDADSREAALASKIAYGVIQNMILLDYYISNYSSIKPERMDAKVLDIIRLSAYQLIFLSKIPERAAVNEGVMLAKKYTSRASGFVNAVLRKIAASKENLPEIKGDNFIQKLSIKYSHPEWLVEYYIKRLGEDSAEKLLSCSNSQPPTYIQVNTLKADADSVSAELIKKGAQVRRHKYLEECIEASSYGNIETLDIFKRGEIYVQDPAAKMSVMAAGLISGMRVMDACAAPGGKSFAAAITMRNIGKILSCDIHSNKLKLIDSGAERLGIDIIETRAGDARNPIEEFERQFDCVIADVPCSGIGTIRKKPDIRYKDPKELADLPEIQLAILENISEYVKPGGVLIYSTCTVLERENEDVVKRFCGQSQDFEFESVELPQVGVVKDGYVTLWPHINNSDGFFISKLRRRK